MRDIGKTILKGLWMVFLCWTVLGSLVELQAQTPTAEYNPVYYFESCRHIKDNTINTCSDAEMKNFIFKNMMKYLKKEMLEGKEKTNLAIKIDTTGKVVYTVLTWLKDGKYGVKELNRNEIFVKGFRTKKDLYLTYKVPSDLSLSQSGVRIGESMVFKIVENMPVIDSCGSTSKMAYKTCINTYFAENIRQNIKYHPNDVKNGTNGKMVFFLEIEPDGSLTDVSLYSKAPTPEAEKSVLDAFKAIKSKNKQFVPGFQFGNPVSVLLVVEYMFKAQ
jgi:hypothetical protein